MSRRNLSVATLSRLFAILMGLIIWASCGGSSSTTTTTGSPAVTLSATSLTFTGQAPGTSSAAQTVTVTDSGTASLTFTSITLTAGTSDFSLSPSNTCGTGIGAGGTCTIYVTFTPPAGASGTLTGTLTITDNASPSTQPVSLTGTATAPTASVLPPSLTFSSQAVGTSSASQPVTLSAPTSALSITSIAVTAGTNDFFLLPASNCGSSVSAGSSCTINVTFTPSAAGTRTGTLTITDNASPGTQTVSLTGTGAAASVSLSPNTPLTFASLTVGSTSAPQSVAVTNTGTLPLTISSIALGGTDSVDFALASGTGACTYTGETLPVSAQCTVYVTFTPQASGTLTGAVTITDDAGGVTGSTQTISLTGTGFSNTVQVNVNLGLPGLDYVNGIFTTVTVCVPGTTNCTTIPDVLVDTGSFGLRLLSTGAENADGTPLSGTQVGNLNLPQVTDPSTGYPLYECVPFGDLSYTWGPMQMATVQVGGETASALPGATANTGIPVQVITSGTPPELIIYNYEGSGNAPYYNPCTYSSNGTATGGVDNDTVANLGANGILGVGNFPQDCGLNCAASGYESGATTGQYLEYDSSSTFSFNGTTLYYYVEPTPLTLQAWNPVAAFPVDNNGVWLSLPSIPAAGQATAAGTLTFGIGTETNNAIPGAATVYELDEAGYFGSATFAGVTFCTSGVPTCPSNEGSGGTFFDSGSDFLYISDTGTLSAGLDTTVSDCGGNYSGFFCPASTLSIPLTVADINGTSTTVHLSLGNALDLFDANPLFAAFNDVGTESCTPASSCSPSTDSWDLGLPFFFGQPNGIFIGIAGTSVGSVTSTNGYYAF